MKYSEVDLKKVQELAANGLSLPKIAVELGVHIATVYAWKNEHEEFAKAVAAGRNIAIRRLMDSAMNIACGYTVPVQKIMKVKTADGEKLTEYTDHQYVKPDIGMLIFLLKNLDREGAWTNEPQKIELEKIRMNLTDVGSNDPHDD